MLATMINKELRSIIRSSKFTGTFLVCTLLILLSFFTGIKEYKESVRRFEAASQLVTQQLQQQTSWARLQTKAYRRPDPMNIFVSGLEYDIGRWSGVAAGSTAKLKNSIYSDESIYAIFRVIDFTFIVQFVLTLFAILFTYNAVSGEREDGTMRLVFSNPVSRTWYLLAKCAGAWLALVIPLCIPILLGILMVLLSGVPLTADHWVKIGLVMALSLLLFTFFIILGVLVSLLTRRPAVSLLVSLVVWVLFVLIVPRVGVMSAGKLVNVPRVAEIEARISGYAQQRWEEFYQGMEGRFVQMHDQDGTGLEMDDEKLWEIMQVEDSLRKKVEKDIVQYDLKVREDLRQRKGWQEHLALNISRLSPAAAYQLGVMSLGGTGLNVKDRYEEAINDYRSRLVQFADRKQAESGDLTGRMISLAITDSSSQFNMTGSREKRSLDLTGMPRFTPPVITLADALFPAVTDFGILALYSILTFLGAFVVFLRYDLR